MKIFKKKPKYELNVYFAPPGVGKTTFLASLAKKDLQNGFPVYTNVEIKGCHQIERSDIGFFNIHDCHLLFDEVAVEYNNRNFKSLPQETIKFFKYHRHFRVAVDVFSQSFDDMDITLRRLARNMYLLKKSLIPGFIYRKTIKKKIDIDENTKQIIDSFAFVPLSRRYIFAPAYWKMFDSFTTYPLPDKEFPVFGSNSAAVIPAYAEEGSQCAAAADSGNG